MFKLCNYGKGDGVDFWDCFILFFVYESYFVLGEC
jgi:hypothetical protein